MKKSFPLLALSVLALSACGGAASSSQAPSIAPSSVAPESSLEPVISSSEVSSVPQMSDIPFGDDFIWFPELKVEVNQKQFLGNFLLEYEDSEILIFEPNMLEMEGDYLVAKQEGETYIAYHADGKYQKIKVSIAPAGTYKRAYRFNDLSLRENYLCAFGDSVTADETLGENENVGLNGSVYARRFAKKYKMYFSKNYAVGGTTGTYVTFNKNIMSEYGGGKYQYLDGCDLVYKNREALKNVDYMFLSYGYNDLYYQVPIDAEGDDTYCDDNTFACCHSFKGSYRYMINVARKANPDITIILMGINFNEYDPDSGNFGPNYKFDVGLRQQDYRKAIYEIGYEKDCKVIDTWNYTKGLYDYKKAGVENPLYKDFVHLTKEGQRYLANYIFKW